MIVIRFDKLGLYERAYKKPDDYKLNPLCETTKIPGETQPPYIKRFDRASDKWVTDEDHRGKIFYDIDGNQIKIINLGSVPPGLTIDPPPIDEEELEAARKKSEAMGKILEILYNCVKDSKADLFKELKAGLEEFL
jgi:hypothetical protein